MSLVRITGTVLGVDTREGVSDKGAWKMRSARVLVAGEDVTPVGLPDKMADPGKLDAVDLLCRVRKSGNFLNIDAVSVWTQDHEDASV